MEDLGRVITTHHHKTFLGLEVELGGVRTWLEEKREEVGGVNGEVLKRSDFLFIIGVFNLVF